MDGDQRRCSEKGQLLRRLRITTPERVAGLDKPVEPERSLRPIDKQFAANPTGRPAIELKEKGLCRGTNGLSPGRFQVM
jgi:hypothetical protein